MRFVTIFQMRALIIGGTRNLGPSIVQALLERGYDLTVFNRGLTTDDLPQQVLRVHGDRSEPSQLKTTLQAGDFELIVDTTLYNGAEAQAVVELFSGHVGCYIFLSTGQVYLVRVGLERPFKEQDYSGPVMPEPSRRNDSEYQNWLYGYEKRQAEDVFSSAWNESRFPCTSLRLPMVNSARDHYHRIYNYIRRIQDGGPILIPEGPGLPIRHVHGEDVVQAITQIAQTETGKGSAYNIGQDETVSIDDFLQLLATLLQKPLNILRVPRAKLERAGLLPQCSPFSGAWMSSLDNTLSKTELGIRYTPFHAYLEELVEFFARSAPQEIEGYGRRQDELILAAELVS